MIAIDRELLQTHGACPEGAEWLGQVAPDGRLQVEDGLRALLAEGREDWLAWVFFRMPAIREAAPESARRALAGPRHRELGRTVDAIPSVRWLAGAGSDADAVAVQAVAAHRAALAPFAPPGTLPEWQVRRVPLVQAWATTAARWTPEAVAGGVPGGWGVEWQAAWAEAGGGVSPGAGDDPWDGLRTSIRTGLQDRLAPASATATQARAATAVFARAAATAAWQSAVAILAARHPLAPSDPVSFAAASLAESASADAGLEALWLLADVESPSPFAPLLGLWDAGLWPAGPAGDTFWVGDPAL